MPELPEVETIVNDLRKEIVGKKIAGVWFDVSKIIKKPKPDDLKSQIKGLKIIDVQRRGKNILIYLDSKTQNLNPKLLLIHQKLTGHLLYGRWEIKKTASNKCRVVSLLRGALEEKVNNYIHFILFLDNGWQVGLSDLRKFAKVLFGSKEEIENLAELKNLGPEPLSANFRFINFVNLIKPQKRKIKQVLMDQETIAGIGNIYSDEILWKARVNPFAPADKLTISELKKLYSATRRILRKAIKLRGTSISDYRDAFGKSGGYDKIRKVYQREGELCPRCGSAIKRIKMGGRSVHFCLKCQKL
jgi:formamidopyrimidine-DNA glycosylase